MGALATWGAVAGGAGAGKEYLERRQAQEYYVELSDIDKQREQALQRIKDQAAMERQRESDTAAMERTREQVAGQAGVTAQKTESAERVQAQRSETAIKVAEISADARRKVASISSGQNTQIITKQLDALLDRYEPRTVSRKEASDIPGFPIEVTDTAVFDNQTGQHFAQVGDKLFQVDPSATYEPKVPPPEMGLPPEPTPKMVQVLLQNPTEEFAGEFQRAYGYLPAAYFEAKLKYDVNDFMQNVPSVDTRQGTSVNLSESE